MNSLEFGRFAVNMGVAAALLAGCGGSQPPIGAPGVMPQSGALAQHVGRGKSWMLPEAKSDDLLYAAGPVGIVSVFAYPSGKRVGNLDNLFVDGGICSDQSGNVFIPAVDARYHTTVYEFVHGGTMPIAALDDPNSTASGCASDPMTGNLCVANEHNGVAVYQSAQGTPTFYYPADVPPLYCAYDNKGNLFVDNGIVTNTIAELPKNGNSFVDISLDAYVGPISLQWVKDRFLTAGSTSSPRGPQPIFEVAVSGSTGHVTGPAMLSTKNGKHDEFPVQFFLNGTTLIGPSPRNNGNPLLNFWSYPKGGEPKKTVNDPEGSFYGVTVSLASRR